ncbi:hypothetical protein BAW75_04410 [Micromonospora chalcea]|nr:hypothetical protein BAW75_04410 [Micromonospora chalcea]
MAGQVDLGHHSDVPAGRVRDDVPVVVAGVPAAGAAADSCRAAHLGEPGPGVDGDPPALVVGEVQVQVVELVPGQVVDHPQHVLDGEEVPGHVEHGAPVGETRTVDDRAAGHCPAGGDRRGALDRGRQELP